MSRGDGAKVCSAAAHSLFYQLTGSMASAILRLKLCGNVFVDSRDNLSQVLD